MTKETLEKANAIADKIERLEVLCSITNLPHCMHDLIIECSLNTQSCRGPIRIQDKGLREVIHEYCINRIRELNKELNEL